MPDFRRGKEHIARANESSQGGGEFRPFIQNFYWKEDGESQYLLILNPIDDIPMVKLQKVFAEGRPHHLIARTDEAIGEKKDPIEDQWDYDPKDNNVCVAVSLVPTIEKIKNRNRPTGFEVEVKTFDRKVRDDKGEPTDEREEITTPVVGFIAQSPNNFFNRLASTDANVAPIESTPIRITRTGERLDTDYEVEAFEDKPIDLSGLLDFVDGITYLNDEMDELLEGIEGAEDDFAAAGLIGSLLLDKKLNDMCDEEYYNEVLEKLTEPAKFSKKRKESSKKSPIVARPVRQSQRRSQRQAEDSEPSSDKQEPEAETEEEKPKPRRSRKAVSKEESSPRERMNALRERSAVKADKA
jgi:hypothetical protein